MTNRNKYIVHLYATVRVKLREPVEAGSATEAAEKAATEVWGKLGEEFDHTIVPKCAVFSQQEFSEEVQYALVDVEGDEQFEKSEWVDLHKGEIFDRAISTTGVKEETL